MVAIYLSYCDLGLKEIHSLDENSYSSAAWLSPRVMLNVFGSM
jgi:hypothetical protein